MTTYTLGTHFEELDRAIRPPQHRLDAARDLPPLVRDYLNAHEDFATVAPHSRLVGSYAQDLVAGDVKDVDFLVRVPWDPEADEPAARDVLRGLRSALVDLPQALESEGIAEIDLTRARRSVHVYFANEDFHLDVVPCIAPHGFDDVLYVPDWGFETWVPSHPVGYVSLLDELNVAHGGKVKRLARLFKHFRNVHMKTRKPKSYWLGALVVHHVRRDGGLDMTQPLAVLFRDLVTAIYSQYASTYAHPTATPNIPDPMLGHNVLWNWERSHFETFMRRLEDARTWSNYALNAETREAAVFWWQKVFGPEYFPSEVQEAAKRLAEDGWPGKAVVTGSGLVLPSGTATSIVTPTRPTRYYGA